MIREGDKVFVLKYGSWYPANVLKRTPTRALIKFTTKGGTTKELYVPLTDVRES